MLGGRPGAGKSALASQWVIDLPGYDGGVTRFLPTAEEQARPRGRRGFFGLAASGVAAALVATSITAAVLPASDDRTWPWHVADILIYSAAFILAAATLDGYWTPARRLLGIGKPAAGADALRRRRTGCRRWAT